MIQHRAESFVNYLSCIADEKSFKGMKSDCSLATPQDPLLTNEFADQILEGGVTRADGKKQGSIKRLINLVDDTDDSDVEITQPTEKTKSRRQASFGTATRKPMLQSTIDVNELIFADEEIDGDGDGEEEKLPTFELSMGKMKMSR
ncbi:hypothetical protein Bca4012_051478 [Brassica carinata]